MIEDYSPIETIKIIDFGFADHLSILKSENSQSKLFYKKGMVNGTPHYLSP
jgi:serine/threonine protein kinase